MKNTRNITQDKLEGAAIVFLLLLFVVVSRSPEVKPPFSTWWSDMAWTLFSGATAWRTFMAARSCKGSSCKGWLLISAANFAWFIGILNWDFHELALGNATPYPGISDIGFMLFAVLMIPGFYLLRSFEHRQYSYKLIQISKLGIVACSLLITHMVFFNIPLQTLESSVLYKVTAIAYPILYISTFFFTASLFWYKDHSIKEPVINYLLLSLAIHAIAVSFYAYSLLGKNYQTGNYIDILWLIAFAATYRAATLQLHSNDSPGIEDKQRINTMVNINLDVLLPVASLILLAYSIFYTRYELTPDLMANIFPIFILLTLFIGVREWSNKKFESLLTEKRRESEEKVIALNKDLEHRVSMRTEELKNTLLIAEQANNAKSEFLSRMSHELRTPLNAILGFSQILEINANKDGNNLQERNAKEIIDAGNHLLYLINEILDIAKIEAGTLEIVIEEVSVENVLNESTLLIKSQIERKNIELSDTISSSVHSVKADFNRLKQVLLNLLSNAVKYNYENGKITITSQKSGNDYVRICITNTGQGLTNTEISKLFVPFERLNYSTNVEGTGIGLVISKNLIEAMNGTIGVESKPGVSTTFWIDLPLSS